MSEEVAKCVYACVRAGYCVQSDLLREYAISTAARHFMSLLLFQVVMITF